MVQASALWSSSLLSCTAKWSAHEVTMGRGVGQSSQWKWLRPGMGVKRWLILLVVGLVFLVLAVSGLPRIAGVWNFLQQFHAPYVNPVVEVLILLGVGLVLVALAVLGLNRTLLSAFRRSDQAEVVDLVYRHRQRQSGPKVVAIGGGHGLNTLLRGLKEYTDHITAIVTAADDGGSSGRLRRELGILPPGDFRDCMAALSDAEGLVTQLFQFRFADNTDLSGHSFGNLYLTAMTAITGSFESALEESSRVLAVRGRVVPSTLAQVTLGAEVLSPEPADAERPDGPSRVRQVLGQSNISHTSGRIQRVYLQPEDAPAYPEAIRAILDADMIVIGPGSLYTSVLPNLLVRDLHAALRSASALKVYVCNVATELGETAGYDVADHVEALADHVGRDLFSVVLANGNVMADRSPGGGAEWVHPPADEPGRFRLILADLVDPLHPWRHDPIKLAQALMALLGNRDK
jgi:uncharacterized cofD-like protein